MFFKTRPNLSPNEKAQVEYCFQWIADCIGPDRMRLPVTRSEELLSGQSMDEFVKTIGSKLQHNIDQLNIVLEPQLIEKCSSGG